MKRILTIVAITMLSLTAFNKADAQLRWGVKAGANLVTAPTEIKDFTTDYIVGYHVGPMAEFKIPFVPLAIDASLLFSQKGVDFNQESKQAVGDYARNILRTNYIEVPVNAKFYFTLIPNALRAYLQAGPSFDFLISTSIEGAYKKPDELLNLSAKKFGVSLNAGIGVEIMKIFQISASYTASMTENYQFDVRNVAGMTGDYINAKNKGFLVTAAVLF